MWNTRFTDCMSITNLVACISPTSSAIKFFLVAYISVRSRSHVIFRLAEVTIDVPVSNAKRASTSNERRRIQIPLSLRMKENTIMISHLEMQIM